MKHKLFDEIYSEEAQPDGPAGATKRARKSLMLQRTWPVCKCYKPFSLNCIIQHGNKYQVYLYCEDCASGRYNMHHETDLLG
jgi:hypothetical protein